MVPSDAWSNRQPEPVPRWRALLSRRQRAEEAMAVETPPGGHPRGLPPQRMPSPQPPPPPQQQQDPSRHPALRRLGADLGRSRVIAFVNPKGGVHKTTATVLTAAAIGSVRRQGVIAWDDNELRGTLGLRAGTARHARTIRHLVADIAEVEASGNHLREVADDYLRHASDGSFDVLAGDEDPKLAQRLEPEMVLRVLDILTRTHQVVCIDTGNNVESPNWKTIVGAVDQLVVTTVPREDAAFAADWMMDLLIDEGYRDLVANAVTLLSCPTPRPGPLLDDLSRHFASRTRDVAVVPYDPALEPGAAIQYSELRPSTQYAWLSAAERILLPFLPG